MQQNSQEGQRLQTGRWSREEHQRFMYAIVQYGKDWKKVQAYVRTRSGSQVRSHAQKFFNKLQKTTQHQQGAQRSHQQFSQTEFDIQRQLNNEYTPSTPLQLVTMIKKHSKEEGGKIDLGALKQKFEETHERINHSQQKSQMPSSLVRQNSYKSMSNILSAYEQIKQEKQEKHAEDEGLFILLTKKYKKYLGKIGDFDKLIDIHNSPIQHSGEPVARKRSFTLPEGSNLSGDELEQKLEQIKKQIHVQSDKSKYKHQKEEKREGRFGRQLKQEVPNLLNRLDTIQQNCKEEQENASFRAIPSLDTFQPNNKQSTPQ